MAFGVLEALRLAGRSEASAISVVGFDDVPAAAEADLTTVRQPIQEKGRLMARMLLDPALTETRVELPTELVIRGSSRPPFSAPRQHSRAGQKRAAAHAAASTGKERR